jgi:hypothetical protein
MAAHEPVSPLPIQNGMNCIAEFQAFSIYDMRYLFVKNHSAQNLELLFRFKERALIGGLSA